jgi:hypothetical protein
MINEEQLQANCVKWFDNNYPLERGMLFAVDNNLSHRLSGVYRAIEGNRKKAIGCRAGVSDLIFITSDGVYFIELKLAGGYQSPEQKDFQKKIEARGWTYVIIRELSEFQDFINAML